jgi:hypothetical protein
METIPLHNCTSDTISRITLISTKFNSSTEAMDPNNNAVAFVMYINLHLSETFILG